MPKTEPGLRVGYEMVSAGTSIEEGQGGAGGYHHGLVPALLADERIGRLVVYCPEWYERAGEWSHPKLDLRWCKVPRSRAPRVAWEQLVLPLRCRRDRLDVLFSPANFRPLAYRGVNVLALHAVQHFVLDHGGASDVGRLRSAYLNLAQPRSATTADRVVAVTETLRTDALRVFDLDPARIVAVNMGPSPWAAELLGAAGGIEPHVEDDDTPYVLCISRLYEHKNHRRLLEAFVRATAEGGLPHRLLVVGGDADVTREDLERQARELGAGDRIRVLGRVPQADVPGLYKGAALVAYPSLYETFGHPVLEAFAIGRPLLTSTTGATAEVAGGAAMLVDPLDVEDIARGLREVLEDDGLAADMVARGDRRIRDFTWEGCARGTVDQLVAAVDARARSR